MLIYSPEHVSGPGTLTALARRPITEEHMRYYSTEIIAALVKVHKVRETSDTEQNNRTQTKTVNKTIEHKPKLWAKTIQHKPKLWAKQSNTNQNCEQKQSNTKAQAQMLKHAWLA